RRAEISRLADPAVEPVVVDLRFDVAEAWTNLAVLAWNLDVLKQRGETRQLGLRLRIFRRLVGGGFGLLARRRWLRGERAEQLQAELVVARLHAQLLGHFALAV